jgi:hypothetical protein
MSKVSPAKPRGKKVDAPERKRSAAGAERSGERTERSVERAERPTRVARSAARAAEPIVERPAAEPIVERPERAPERTPERAERPEREHHHHHRMGGDRNDRGGDDDRSVVCRSCGKRPGRPTAILGQMTQAELCPQCTQMRKERIRLNRAAARGMRSSRLY